MKMISSIFFLTLVGSAASAQPIQPQVISPSPVPGVEGGLSPIVNLRGPTQVAPLMAPQMPAQQQATPTSNSNNGAASQIQKIIEQMMANGRGSNTDTVPDNTDWSKYEYPDNFKFYYGGEGVKNIGDGLCTANNVKRSQVRDQYCKILSDVVTREGTCANRELGQILNKNIGQLHEFCPTFASIKEPFNRQMVYVQILASLITLESGWKTTAQEKPWTKEGTGQQMGGKGLFQIGNWDTAQDPDCRGVGGSGIFDPTENIKCGACIALKNLNKDATIGYGTGESGARGMARYFGPMRDGQSSKRNAMKGAVSNWCTASANSSSKDNYGGAPSGGNPASGGSTKTNY